MKKLNESQQRRIGRILVSVWERNCPAVFQVAVESHKKQLSLNHPLSERGLFAVYQIASLVNHRTEEGKHKMQMFILDAMVGVGYKYPPEYGGSAKRELKRFTKKYGSGFIPQ